MFHLMSAATLKKIAYYSDFHEIGGGGIACSVYLPVNRFEKRKWEKKTTPNPQTQKEDQVFKQEFLKKTRRERRS